MNTVHFFIKHCTGTYELLEGDISYTCGKFQRVWVGQRQFLVDSRLVFETRDALVEYLDREN